MNNPKQRIDWLDVVTASDDWRDGMRASLHTVRTGEQVCYGICLDEQWLSGSNAPVLFNSTVAARNFLRMIGIESPPSALGLQGAGERFDGSCRTAQQCFHMSPTGGLGVCPHKRSEQWQAIHHVKAGNLKRNESFAAS